MISSLGPVPYTKSGRGAKNLPETIINANILCQIKTSKTTQDEKEHAWHCNPLNLISEPRIGYRWNVAKGIQRRNGRVISRVLLDRQNCFVYSCCSRASFNSWVECTWYLSRFGWTPVSCLPWFPVSSIRIVAVSDLAYVVCVRLTKWKPCCPITLEVVTLLRSARFSELPVIADAYAVVSASLSNY